MKWESGRDLCRLENDVAVQAVRRVMEDDSIEKKQVLQQLWSGYGEIFRCISQQTQTCYVVKYISPPQHNLHPRGWNSDIGHQRKLRSYEVEQQSYQDYGPFTDSSCRVPDYYDGWHRGDERILVLEDLADRQYSPSPASVPKQGLRAAVRWLAAFHGCFMGNDGTGLWEFGGYWHLSTRKDEWDKMSDGPLKKSAGELDQCLRNTTYHTLIHGDGKLANLCFDADFQQVAAVDFQYTGKGVGVQDLMLLMASTLDHHQLVEQESVLLREYFLQLKSMLSIYGKQVNFDVLEKEWRQLWPLVWADFERFLQGWSPEHVRITPYMQQHSHQAVLFLSS